MADTSLPLIIGPPESSPGAVPFEYTPLAEGQIRLLQLHPASQEQDQLRGELVVTHLNDLPPGPERNAHGPSQSINAEKHVCFEAISYVWGNGALTESVVTSRGFIPITATLASVLQRLRDQRQSRLYWADALCIDQLDMAEKEVQVSLMGVIYSSAVRVLCDLSEDAEDFNPVLDAMRRYWKKNIRHGFLMGQGNLPWLSGEATANVLGLSMPTNEEADAIEDVDGEDWTARFLAIMSLPWFHRLWVVQEFVLGRDVDMVFGRRRVPWGEFWAGLLYYKGAFWPWVSAGCIERTFAGLASLLSSFHVICLLRACRLTDPETTHGREFTDGVKHLGSVTNLNQTLNLPLCLMAFCSSGCTIPRDRYFGILGMVDMDSNEIPRELQPDYKSPMRDITMRFWRYALKLTSGGDLLLTAGLPGRVEGYPSWLRDISTTSPWDHIWMAGAAGEAAHKAGGPTDTWFTEFFDDDPERMFVQGYRLDDIIMISVLQPERAFSLKYLAEGLDEAFSFFTSDFKTLDRSKDTRVDTRYTFTGEHVSVAVLKTLCNYNKNDTLPPYDEKFKNIVLMGLKLHLVATSDTTQGDDVVPKIGFAFADRLPVLEDLLTRIYASWGLRLCKTSKGLFAALPKEACIGDSVWIIKGCRLPLVLRPSISHPGSFDLVGGGYVHGVMNGEALETPGFKWRGVSLR
ncbi:hypothetical protein NM208_g2790 [Fusarium decemcellulare]|uniref:Uncharacterized protein n=1 Tax=Fusarium decemcellulare TaxID=57161 RepID=A0ACC1SRQ9_9HYPO|nr:hypothetical protein NM208_g2790 [Fusarium decemcellulare]